MSKIIDKTFWINFLNTEKDNFSNNIFFDNFIKDNTFLNFEENTIKIKVKNDFIKNVLDKEYKTLFEEKITKNLNEKIKISFLLNDLENSKNKKENTTSFNNNLNKDLTFNNYIVGKFNKEVFNITNSILKKNIKINPIFIYGSTGTGKTHFLNAIGLKYQETFPEEKVYFMNTEDFLRNVYNVLSQSGKKIEEFKNSFNDVDLLLVDDIQFLSNKDKLNEFFFSIFNYLISKKKIVIMTSDKIPNDIKIDNRMISRFNSGLTIRLPKPDLKTIKEIIIFKIKNENLFEIFTNNAIEYIVNRFNDDIRILEGVMNKIFFSLNISDKKIDIVNENTIKPILNTDDESIYSNIVNINPNVLINNISLSYGLNPLAIKSKQRQKQISFVRKICIYVLRENLNLSFSEIGGYFSNRDHSTIITSYNFVKDLIKKDKELESFLNKIVETV